MNNSKEASNKSFLSINEYILCDKINKKNIFVSIYIKLIISILTKLECILSSIISLNINWEKKKHFVLFRIKTINALCEVIRRKYK